MKQTKKIAAKILLPLLTVPMLEWLQAARSPFRITNNIPTIITRYENSPISFVQQDSHIQYYPFFQTYDKDFLDKHTLPNDLIEYRFKKSTYFSGKQLQNDLAQLVIEIKAKRRNYTHFKIIQNKNFNRKMICGLIILKHKKLPIIVKLFAETPKTLIYPRHKGIDPLCFFYMAGGVNRHFAGFTRIKNKEYIEHWATTHVEWKNRILLPRKWFWAPETQPSIIIEGHNLEEHNNACIKIPSLYAIIADYFPFKTAPEYRSVKKNIIMKLCNDIKLYIDPHETNFFLIKNQTNTLPTVSIVDTEHFPTMVGINTVQPPQFKNHIDWLMFLVNKCFHDMYLRTKSMRQHTRNKQLF